ncbi:MAG: hypothetical protein A3I05_08865 [Deltaproteobacteria bacterium RIFCSPLOWO2_02_FULL_44_10]|nr:MAG: hypothetical protein A3C46_08750 [Deltaproteobacteria bacterium RIFCSPHIGHO2_02_FULL_44_16]OGQ45218.1 MAG: hypothetical protein A3I05_08865 [Deltaproteobacteria bacterium RIFCSPLOWO2_02_FULL_44_10]
MKLYLGEATSIVFKTFPYIFLRFLVYGAFAIGFLVYLGVVYLIAEALAGLHEHARLFVWVLALGASYPLIRLAQEYLLYLVKAGHLAVITELIMHGSLPQGVSQTTWGKEAVKKRFASTSALFLVDRLVAGVIRTLNGVMWRITSFFGVIPGVAALTKIGTTVLHFSLTYVDEAILARNFLRKDESIWESAQTGLVLYAQAWREILKTALVLGAISMIFLPVLFLLLLGPFLAAGYAFPSIKFLFVLAAIFGAYVIKAAFLDPWMLTNMILTYVRTTEGMAVNPEWNDKLASMSKKFRKLQEKTSTVAPVGETVVAS